MSAKWEKQEGNVGVLTVEVPAEEVNGALDKAFKKVVKEINVPGFRKGKMPRQMFEKRFGVESLYQDALDFILPDAYANAVEEAGINPVDRPEIDIEKLEKNEPLVFTAKVTVKPEVELGEYKGLEVSKEDTNVTDEEIEEQLKESQERMAELTVKEDGQVENGDTAVIDFEGFVDGEAFEGGAGNDYSLEIGSNSFIPGFEEQLIGAKTGEQKDVEVTFPEEYHAEELAGKSATFKVTVNEVKAKELPELNDEFAKELDEEVDGLDALRTKMKENLKAEKDNASETQMRDQLVQKAAENATVEIPQAMIDSEIDRMMQDFEQRLSQQGMNKELYFQFSGQDEDALREQMKADAETRVRVSLTLEAIAKAENMEVTSEDIDKELEKMAGQFNMDAEQIKTALGGTEMLENDIRMQNTVEFLVENAKISDAKAAE
ncbi:MULTISPECIES: trigger factor [unclassified Planococcus (in: firmicutes)]|uniref:trigger factor n=1 Tax=unclassified Planococcus (in: firmicutes) TaxID=2662419 RepID=UPI000C34B9C5|nr:MULTISPECIES: trigger factor [unclassified Planococcus (in: firmicutes)]AUD13663.1 trigger factor [Planococcus sp. MB-3u-03]PKG45880.1 trigger factor [Planococcus sp. Urea-trap-24]PKG88411.1 trigger factor [Planococcus sp. Urea-3u-39]PKH38871.1 trigger factor [Planococcus sp. MB-3u-09]